MTRGLRGCLLCFVTVLAGVAAEADADAPLRDVLAAALEANERLARLADELRAENARLRETLAQRDAELEQAMAALAVLQRMVFGRSSERSQPDATDRASAGDGDGGPGGGRAAHRRRGRAGNSRRDYSHLPRVEVIWDFGDGGYRCPRCEDAFESLGDLSP